MNVCLADEHIEEGTSTDLGTVEDEQITNENETSDNVIVQDEAINEYTAKISALEENEKSYEVQLQLLAHENEELISEKKRTEHLHQMSIQEKNREINLLNSSIQEKDKANEILKNENSILSLEVEKYARISHTHQEVLTIVENKKQLIAQHEVTIQALESTIVGLSARYKESEEKVNSFTKDKNLISDMEGEIQKWIEKLTSAEKSKFEVESELAHQGRFNNEVQGKLSIASETIEALEKELNEFKNNSVNRIESPKSEINNEANITAQLNSEIESLLKLISTKDEELDKINKENIDLQEKLDISLQNGIDAQEA